MTKTVTEMSVESLGCLISTALLNGPTLRGKLSDSEAAALGDEIINALEEFSDFAGSQIEPEAPLPEMAHLDAARLRLILDRHIRWREQALRLLEQVNTGYEGEWPEIAEFVRNSTTRPVLAERTDEPEAPLSAGVSHEPDCDWRDREDGCACGAREQYQKRLAAARTTTSQS